MAAQARAGSLVWLRRDTRIVDHAPLLAAADADVALPFFAFDGGQLRFGSAGGGPPSRLPALGPHRCRFLLECLADLQRSLQRLGSGLHFSHGTAAAAIASLVPLLAAEGCTAVSLHYHLDYGLNYREEEAAAEAAFLHAAAAAGVNASVHSHWDRTLIHPEDLPTAWTAPGAAEPLRLQAVADRLAQAPTVMTDFRKAVEAQCQPQPPLPSPASLPGMPAAAVQASAPLPALMAELYAAADAGDALEELGSMAGGSISLEQHPDPAFPVGGGEAAAAARLQHMLHGSAESQDSFSTSSRPAPPLAGFKDSRMLATGADASAKLSASLNHGCLSARQAWAALQGSQVTEETAEGCQWLRMHLQIRDFFQFMHHKRRTAPAAAWRAERPPQLAHLTEAELFGRWCRGETGLPFVDAGMRELAATGYTSNRSRQNAASLLAKGLGVDWRWGEAWFRCLLLDYDPAANEGNWAYQAGADLDPRAGARLFRTVSQGMRYDPGAELIARWLPPLRGLPAEARHQPWLRPGGVPGYPPPLLPPASQLTRQDQLQLEQQQQQEGK